jgi:5-methylcytosine-specific restriction endonuclease McrA
MDADNVMRLFDGRKELISRKKAKELGLKRYYTGVLCKRGHDSERKTACGNCIQCDRIAQKGRQRTDNMRASARAYNQRNKAKVSAITKRWSLKNREKIKEYCRRRRAIVKASEGTFTKEDIARIRKSQSDRCGFCKIRLRGGGHLDHIVPASKGGTSYPSNLQWLCASCNSGKRDRDQIEFARSKGLLL